MSWITTYPTGSRVYPLEMTPSMVVIEDVAHALSMQCRFSGHVREFYSVAQHCVLASLYCDLDDMLAGLLHDASEAYLVDVPRPLKRHRDFAFYITAERRCMAAIGERFGIASTMPPSVRTADSRLLTTEARDLRDNPGLNRDETHEPYERRVAGWSPDRAEAAFLARFRTITEAPDVARQDSILYGGER